MRRIQQIKTLGYKMGRSKNREEVEDKVNKILGEGWTLHQIDVLPDAFTIYHFVRTVETGSPYRDSSAKT